MRPHLSTTDAERILGERYPDLFEQAGEAPNLLATAAVARVAADLRAIELGTRTIAPVTRSQLEAAMVLIPGAADGVDYAELLGAAYLRSEGVHWRGLAELRGYDRAQAARTRFKRLQEKFSISDAELPTPATLPAHIKRARALIEVTAGPANLHLVALAADALGALLLAARYNHITGADLRAWIEDPQLTGAAEALATAPHEVAEAAHRILTDIADLEGARGEVNALVLDGIDQWDPPAQDRA